MIGDVIDIAHPNSSISWARPIAELKGDKNGQRQDREYDDGNFATRDELEASIGEFETFEILCHGLSSRQLHMQLQNHILHILIIPRIT